MLNRMSVGCLLAFSRWLREAKESSLVIIEFSVARWIGTFKKHTAPQKSFGPLFARIAMKLGMKPIDFFTFSSIGLDASGAVAMANGANSVSVMVLT
jgi:hypothetical protein